MSKEVMQQALDFCVFCWREVELDDYVFERLEKTIDALRVELAKPEPDGPLVEGWQITMSDGHSGYGVYAHMTDYPEEGAVFLAVGVKP